MKLIQEPWIKLRQKLNREDYGLISELQEKCVSADGVALKLELDYKLGGVSKGTEETDRKEACEPNEINEQNELNESNEFMYFDGPQLIGYIGICSFRGGDSPVEINGMVHPDYRRQGIFTMLYSLVAAECRRRNPGGVLLLCDRKSASGQEFMRRTGAVYHHSEYEMYLGNELTPGEELFRGITLRKAEASDAREIARQDAIYFNAEEGEPLIPEEEEKRGLMIYLAEKDKVIIGKVHLQTNTAAGGIYGLGILPEYRGKGYGRALLLRAVEKLKEAGKSEIMLQVVAENETALRLYQSCGFVETSTMDYFEAT